MSPYLYQGCVKITRYLKRKGNNQVFFAWFCKVRVGNSITRQCKLDIKSINCKKTKPHLQAFPKNRMTRRLALEICLSLLATHSGHGQSGLSEGDRQTSSLRYRPATDADSRFFSSFFQSTDLLIAVRMLSGLLSRCDHFNKYDRKIYKLPTQASKFINVSVYITWY